MLSLSPSPRGAFLIPETDDLHLLFFVLSLARQVPVLLVFLKVSKISFSLICMFYSSISLISAMFFIVSSVYLGFSLFLSF